MFLLIRHCEKWIWKWQVHEKLNYLASSEPSRVIESWILIGKTSRIYFLMSWDEKEEVKRFNKKKTCIRCNNREICEITLWKTIREARLGLNASADKRKYFHRLLETGELNERSGSSKEMRWKNVQKVKLRLGLNSSQETKTFRSVSSATLRSEKWEKWKI